MKKKLLILSIFVIAGLAAYAQTVFEYDIKITKQVNAGVSTSNVEITLIKGETPVKYVIINGTTLSDEVLVESEFTTKTEYIFKEIPAGKYLLKIVDEQGRIAGKYFEISN